MVLPTLRVIHSLARSGSTLISRCIGSMNSTCLLSEIHPLGHTNKHWNSICQYQDWYSNIDIQDWKKISFTESIHRIYQDCEFRNQTLVLRDWAHIDFFGPPARRPPTFEFDLDRRLTPHYNLLHCVIARHPLETWRSMRKLKLVIDNNIDIDQFLSGYRKFLVQAMEYPLIKYEDFCHSPSSEMESICRHLELPFDSGFINRWHENNKVTGDIYKKSRAGGSSQIVQLQISPIEAEFSDKLMQSADYQWIINHLQYPY